MVLGFGVERWTFQFDTTDGPRTVHIFPALLDLGYQLGGEESSWILTTKGRLSSDLSPVFHIGLGYQF